MRDQLTTAIQQRRIVTFTYQGHERRVQPAAFGIGNRKGKETLHGYQVGGASRRGGIPHWRNFHVEQIQSLTVLDEVFGPNPPGFNPAPFPQTLVALAASPGQPATEQPQQQPQQAWGQQPAGGQGGAQPGQLIPGVPITADQAAKAAEAASEALGKLGKWFRKR